MSDTEQRMQALIAKAAEDATATVPAYGTTRFWTAAAVQAMDADDNALYRRIRAHLDGLAAHRVRFTPSLQFKNMYAPPTGQVFLLREKHGTRLMRSDTPDSFAASALEVLRERHEQDYYGMGNQTPGKVKETVRFWLDQKVLPEAEKLQPPLLGPNGGSVTSFLKGQPAWTAAMAACREGADASALFGMLGLEIKRSPNPLDDLRVVFLALCLTQPASDYADGVRGLLQPQGRDGIYADFLDAALPVSEGEEVLQILREAMKPGCFRSAGRAACDFLNRRSDAEYESFEFMTLEGPKPADVMKSLGELLADAVPSTNEENHEAVPTR